MKSSLTLVIPAYNEEDALTLQLPQLINYCEEHHWQLIIVNDGSTDQTKDILEQHRHASCLQVLHHKVNQGYGGALKTGISATQTEYLVTLDADGQHRLEDINILFAALQHADADMIIGSRQNQRSANWYRGLGKSIIRTVARILVPNAITDLNSGMKLYRTLLAQQYIILCPNSMAFSDVITLVFLNLRHLVIEHPIRVNKRQGGRSTINTRTALTTLIEIFNLLMLFEPIRLLFPVAFILIILGIGWSLPFFIQGQGLSISALLLMLSSIVTFLFGLIAQQLSLIRKERMTFFTNRSDDKPE